MAKPQADRSQAEDHQTFQVNADSGHGALTPGRCFILILLAALTMRLIFALTNPGFWGLDGGAYLQTVNQVLGRTSEYAGFARPLLAPGWLLAPFDLTFGPDAGYKAWASLFSLAPLAPVYLLTRKHVGAWPAVFAAGFGSVDLLWGEAFVIGAAPLVGFAMLGMAWWSIGELAERFSWRNTVVLTLSIGLIPWTNQTVAGMALVMMPVYWLTVAGVSRSWLTSTWAGVLAGGIIALGALPWYLGVAPGSPEMRHDGPLLYPAVWVDPVWLQVFLAALPVGIFALWKLPDARLKALGAVLIACGLMAPWLSMDEAIINPLYRARHLMALPFYPLITYIIFRTWWHKVPLIVSVAGIVLAAGLMISGWAFTVHGTSRDYAMVMSTEAVEGLEWVQRRNPGAVVATPMWSTSQWVAAYTLTSSPSLHLTAPPPARAESDAQLRCLLGWVDGCGHGTHGVDYFLIDRRLPCSIHPQCPTNYGAQPDQWQTLGDSPWIELSWQQGEAQVWRVLP